MPEPDIFIDGKPTAYSAERAVDLVRFELAKFEQRLNGRLQPVEGLVEQARTQQIQSEATTWARAKFDEAKTWEGWNDVQKDVHALMLRDNRYTIEGAYVKVFKEKYLPGLRARYRQETIDELNRAPKATTAAPGNSAAPAARVGKRKGVDWETAIADAIDKAQAQ
jgi:hypothetical protein